MDEGADRKQPQPSRAMELLEEFNNLSQGDSLEEYKERFGELRLWLLSINPYLPESYFIWCYIKGLKLEIKFLVQLGRPKELEEAMKLAALHNQSATQELAQQPNPKPNSSISTLTETEIPKSTSTAFDVLGEGQTIQESSDRELEVLAGGVLGDLEPELVVEEATELAQVEGITNLPNNVSQEIVDNFGEQEVSYLRQGPDENLAKQGTECKTSKVTSDFSFAVENALDRKLESGMVEVAKDDENGIGNLFCSSQILKKMTDIGMISVGFLKIPVEYQVFGDLADQGSAITKKIDNTFESFAVAYNVFDKMPGEDMVARSMKYNWYLVVFDPGGWQKVNSIGMEKMMLGVGMKLSEYVGDSSRFEPFELCSVGISYGVSILEASSGVGLVFDPGIVNDVVYSFKFIKEGIPFDRGESTTTHVNTQWVLASMGTSFPYDRGRCNIVQVADFLEQLPSGNFVFDPGGTLNWEATAG